MARGSLVAVSYPVDAEFVQINTSVLDGLAEVAFLDGAPDAEFRDTLRQADVLIGWHLGQELPAGAPADLARAPADPALVGRRRLGGLRGDPGTADAGFALVEHEDVLAAAEPAGSQVPGQMPGRGCPRRQ